METKRLALEHLIAHPQQRRYATPLLLLHGAWHGAWCWQAAMQDFARRGFETHAISLRGHGKSDTPRSFFLCSLNDYVRDLATAIASIHPRPILVGHSLGGYVTQLYLMEERLPRAVLLCSMPHHGITNFMLRELRQHPLSTLIAFATCNPHYMVGTPSRARAAFFRPDLPDADLQHYTEQLSQESLRVALEASLSIRPTPARNRTPLLVIAAGQDAIFTLDEQRSLASAYAAELVIIPDATHDLMLDPDWSLAADAIERFAARGATETLRVERDA
ncbi:MAG: alpha/beta fold hydrolase [Roseiflexaceae bacterium]